MKKMSKLSGITTKNESNKGDIRGKSFKENIKDLENERKANKKALKEFKENRSEKREKSLNEKLEDALKDAFKKSLKRVSQIPETAKKIPIELIFDKVEDTTKIIITEAKLKASETVRKKYCRKRNPEEPPKTRNKKSPKKQAFIKWVKDYNIDPYLSLDELVYLVEEAHRLGYITELVGKNTIYECLPIIRKKK
jgi:hypothetical protein